MASLHYRLILALAFFALLPYAARSEPSPEELEEQRKRFIELSKDPEHLARLRRDLRAFRESDKREQILKLDQDLRHEPAPSQAHLQLVLDRYVDWLDRLDDKDRQRIKNAPDKARRLEIIKELREREWIKLQPKARREELEKLDVAARAALVKKYRQEDRQRHEDWQIARAFWEELVMKKKDMLARLSDYAPDVRTYVEEYLLRKLSKEERAKLDQAEGQWPLYPKTLVEVAERHPPALPDPAGPRTLAELPADVRKPFFKKAVTPKEIKAAEGNPLEFAKAVAHYLHKLKGGTPLPHELWPTKIQDLSPPMQDFVKNVLGKVLDGKESLLLVNASGAWPDYPETIQKLAAAHKLRVPWYILPGAAREKWDLYRLPRTSLLDAWPEVPRQKLLHFAIFELDSKERQALKLTLNDRDASMQRLTEAYHRRQKARANKLPLKDRPGTFLAAPVENTQKPGL